MHVVLPDSSKDGTITAVNYQYSKVRPGPDKKARESFGSLQVVNLSYDNISVPERCFFV